MRRARVRYFLYPLTNTVDGFVTIPGFTPPGSNVCSDPSFDVENVSPELCYCACACMVPGSTAEEHRVADGAYPVRVSVGAGM